MKKGKLEGETFETKTNKDTGTLILGGKKVATKMLIADVEKILPYDCLLCTIVCLLKSTSAEANGANNK